MAFSKIGGKGIDVSTDIITEFNSAGIDDNATSTAITIAANNSVSIPNLHGDTTTAGNLTVGGDFIVQGNNFTVDAASLRVEDSLIQLAANNESSDVIDIGFFGHYSNDGNTALHTGFFRDASDEQYYLFNGLEDADLDANNSVTTIDRSGTGFTLADLNTGKINATVDSNIAATFSSTTTTAKITIGDANDTAFIDVNATRLGIGHSSSTSLQALQIEPTSAEAMRIDSDGNVGIGVIAPTARLDVREEKTGGGVLVQVYNEDNSDTTTQTAGIALGPDTRGGTARINAIKENADFSTNAGRDIALTFSSVLNNTPTEYMRITSSGFVGIGQDDPETKLDVVKSSSALYTSTMTGTASYTPSGGDMIQVRNSNSGVDDIYAGIYFETGNPATNTQGSDRSGRIALVVDNDNSYSADFVFQTRSTNAQLTEKMRIDSAGNVGIGETNPDARLTVNTDQQLIARLASSNAGIVGVRLQGIDTSASDNVFVDWFYDAENRQYGFGEGTASGSLPINSGVSHADILINNGNVGIGESSPNARITIKTPGNEEYAIRAGNTGGASGSVKGITNIGLDVSAPTLTHASAYIGVEQDGTSGYKASLTLGTRRTNSDVAPTEAMRIDSAGNVGIGTTLPVYNLHLHEAGSGGVWTMYSNDTTGSAALNGALVGIDSNEEFNIRVYENKPIDFWTNNSHRARITDVGELHLYIGVLDLTDLESPSLPVSIESTGTYGSGGTYDSSLKDSGQLQYNASSHLFADTSVVSSGFPGSWYKIGGGFSWGSYSAEVLTLNSSGAITSTIVDAGDVTFLTLKHDTGSDISTQESFIDFSFIDTNTNETPQVRIGAQVGQNDDAASQTKEGSGAFVVYTNNAESISGDAGTSLAERFRVDYQGNVGIGTASPIYKLHIEAPDTVADANKNGAFLDVNMSGSDVLTADRTHRGLFIDVDSSATGGDINNEHRIHGLSVDVRATGDSDLMYGSYAYAESQHSDGTVSSVVGALGYAVADDTGTGSTSNIYGLQGLAYNYNTGTGGTTHSYAVWAKALLSTSADKDADTATGVYGEVEYDNPGQPQTLNAAYAFQAQIDNDSAGNVTVTNGYLYYGNYAGTFPTNAYGVYIIDVVDNYFAGDLDVGGTKNFKIKHPLPALANTHNLVHTVIEAPSADNIYSGMINLVGGSATINIDTEFGMTEGTFVALNRNVRRSVTNEEGFTAVKCSLNGNILTITAQDNTCTDEVFWMVIGQRQDEEIKASNKTDADGYLILEPEYVEHARPINDDPNDERPE